MGQLVIKILVFVLRPFAKSVRYLMLKIMKRTGNSNDGRPAIAVSGHIIEEIILPAVFKTFREAEFRRLANFVKLPVAEHDRIFNELQVAGIIVAEYALVEAKNYVKDGDFHFWSRVEEQFSRQLQKVFTGFGIDSSNAKLLRDLVKIRQQEYEHLENRVWDSGTFLAPEVKQDIEQKFKDTASDVKRLLSSVHAVVFGTVNHIRRGNIQERDPLVRYLMTRLLQLHNKVVKFVRKL